MRAVDMRKLFTAWALSLCALGAQAQMVAVDQVDPRAVDCLKKTGPALNYPDRDLKLRHPGHIRVSLRFTAADRAPNVEVLFRAASDEMLEELQWHVRGYRLPCMAAGAEPVTAVQEFTFTPLVTDAITWTKPRPVAETEASESAAMDLKAILACMRTPKEGPKFVGALQRDISNAFLELSFAAPDAAPSVKLNYSSVSDGQRKVLVEHVQQYRLPCLPPGAKPVVVRQQFQFKPYGVGARVFKDAVPLMTFLSNIKGIHTMRTDFDLNTMACPFQMAWTLGKPGLDNNVGQLGKPDMNRTEFLAWLGGLEMDIKQRQFEQLVGQTLVVDVPCLKLALQPKT